jgi:hypothetical protein
VGERRCSSQNVFPSLTPFDLDGQALQRSSGALILIEFFDGKFCQSVKIDA